MRLLLDTHLLIWSANSSAATGPMSAEAAELIDDEANVLHFSAASIWETAIKYALKRVDFTVEPHAFRKGLLDNGYQELDVTGEDAAFVGGLLKLHGDPFDRLLVAQATVNGLVLVTADEKLARYPGPIHLV